MRATLVAAALLAVAVPTHTAESRLSLSDVTGAYFSSILGGCWLRVRADHQVSGRCGDRLSLGGWVARSEEGAVIVAFLSETEISDDRPYRIIRPAAPPPQESPSWPPSLADPTAPLLGPDDEPSSYRLLLYPVRWGRRIYLVRVENLKDFCEGPDRTREPRSTAAGEEFLRTGHERLPVAKGVAPECNPASERAD